MGCNYVNASLSPAMEIVCVSVCFDLLLVSCHENSLCVCLFLPFLLSDWVDDNLRGVCIFIFFQAYVNIIRAFISNDKFK